MCAVNFQWLDASRQLPNDKQLAHLERDGRLVILEPGTPVIDDTLAVMPTAAGGDT